MPTIWARKGRLSAAEIQNRRSSARNSASLRARSASRSRPAMGVAVKPALAIAATMVAGSVSPGV